IDITLLVRVVAADGNAISTTCATGRPYTVDAGTFRFSVEGRKPLSNAPWHIRLLEGPRVIESWMLAAPTTVCVPLANGMCAILAVHTVHYTTEAAARLCGEGLRARPIAP